jgi:chorismate mutase
LREHEKIMLTWFIALSLVCSGNGSQNGYTQEEEMNLKRFRQTIDQTDEGIISLFAKRAQAALEIAKVKKGEGLAVFDEEREDAVLKKIEALAKKNQLDPCVMKQIFVLFMAYCRSIEKDEISKKKPH